MSGIRQSAHFLSFRLACYHFNCFEYFIGNNQKFYWVKYATAAVTAKYSIVLVEFDSEHHTSRMVGCYQLHHLTSSAKKTWCSKW